MIGLRASSFVVALALTSFAQHPKPAQVVPDQETAIKIAEAIWLPLYGPSVLSKRPYKAVLNDGYWYVTGSLPSSRIEVNSMGDTTYHVTGGGVPHILISAATCEVVDVGHSK